MKKLLLLFLSVFFSILHTQARTIDPPKYDTLRLYLGERMYYYRAVVLQDKLEGTTILPELSPFGKVRIWRFYDGKNVETDSLVYIGEMQSGKFYERLAKEDVLPHFYLDFSLNLKEVEKMRGGHAAELIFSESYIRNIEAGDDHRQKLDCKLKFIRCMTSSLNLEKLDIVKPLSFVWLYTEYASFDSCQFVSTFRFHIDPPLDSNDQKPDCYFTNASFKDSVMLGGTALYLNMNSFESNTMLWLYDFSARDGSFAPQFYLDNGEIRQRLMLSGRESAFSFGTSVALQGELDVTDLQSVASTDQGKGLRGLFIRESSSIAVNRFSHPESFHLPVSSLSNASIDFQETADLGNSLRYEHLNNLMQSLRDEVSSREISDARRKSDLIAWIDYQSDFHLREYLRHKENKSLSEHFTLWWMTFVEATVRSGYKGEARFFSWLFTLVVLFGLLYLFFFSNEVCRFVSGDSIGDARQLELNFSRKRTFFGRSIDLFRCVWFSFVLFITPRFPAKYFRFSPRLLFVIISEWTIGLLLMIIFVIYIASRYPFIKTLFGI